MPRDLTKAQKLREDYEVVSAQIRYYEELATTHVERREPLQAALDEAAKKLADFDVQVLNGPEVLKTCRRRKVELTLVIKKFKHRDKISKLQSLRAKMKLLEKQVADMEVTDG